MTIRALGWLAFASALAGCQTPAESETPVAALLVAPDAEVRAELSAAAAKATGAKTLLSQGAFTTAPVLTLEPRGQHQMDNDGGTGRLLGKPDRLELWLENGQCVLRKSGSDQQWILHKAQCKPAP